MGILVEGHDFALVYDAGSNDDSAKGEENRFVAYLRAVGVGTKIDHVILSHPHKDHVELLPDVFANYTVGRFWDSGAKTGECAYEQVIAAVKKQNIEYHSATQASGVHDIDFTKACDKQKQIHGYSVNHGQQIKAGQAVALGKGAKMTFIYADDTTERDPNDNSLVVRLDLGTTKVLLMGDAGGGGRDDPNHEPKASSIEAHLLASNRAGLKADILVVGHHGSKTSSRRTFVEAVSPRVAVVSSGPKKYGSVTLPDTAVIDLLAEKARVFRTDRDDETCGDNDSKIGTDSDGEPGGCDNIQITINGTQQLKSRYWTTAD